MIQREMERTRGSLTEKLEALEGQVVDTVSSTTGAVQETTHTVQETVTGAVDAVKETVSTVTDKVQETMNTVTDKLHETVQSVSDTFNLRLQTERHPWVIFGGAVVVGCVAGSTFGSRSEAGHSTFRASEPPPTPWNGGAQYARSGQSRSAASGMWGDSISRLKNIGLSYMMGILRDLAKNELPEAIAGRIAEEIDGITSKLGMEPISGPILPQKDAAESEKSAETRPGYPEKKGNSYRNRSAATAP